jgi:ABC-2 type transport system permease protein
MNWRAVWAITRKDLVDAAKNQWLLLGLIMPIAMALLFRVFFPSGDEANTLAVAVYDPGHSRLVAALRQLPELQVLEAASEEALRDEVEGEAVGGLAVPVGFDMAVEAGERPTLVVYRNVRASGSELAAFRQLLDQRVWALTGQEMPARTTFVDVPALPAGATEFRIDRYLLIILLVLALSMVGNLVVPVLMVEEKEKHTLQVLLVSPARPVDVVVGKALTGLIYSLLVAGVLLALSQGLTGDLPVTIIIVLLGSLFMVAVGLLIGGLCHTTAQVNTWATIIMLVLVLPVWSIEALQPPAFVDAATRLIPSYYLVKPLGLALAGQVSLTQVWVDLAILAGSAIVALAGVVWALRRGVG